MTSLGDPNVTLKVDANSKQYLSLLFMAENLRYSSMVSSILPILFDVLGRRL